MLELAGNASKDLKVKCRACPWVRAAAVSNFETGSAELHLFCDAGEAYHTPSLATRYPW